MDKESEIYQFPEMNVIAGCGAEKIIQKIYSSSLGGKLLLKNNKFLTKEWYEKNLVNYLEFFSPEERFAETAEELEELFFIEAVEWEQENEAEIFLNEMENEGYTEAGPYQKDSGKEQKSSGRNQGDFSENRRDFAENQKKFSENQEELRVVLYRKHEKKWRAGDKNPRIHLKIIGWPFQIPFVVELIPYGGKSVHVEEKELENTLCQEKITYRMFSEEEYLSRSFYKMVDELELINFMSWYRECYDILTTQMVSGRKVSESFGQLLLENAIPLLKERLEIIDSFKDYKYMEKRWENYISRFWAEKAEENEKCYPEWSQMIQLFVRFFAPIFDVVLKNELFIGDWIPQIGRYLD